MRRLFRWAFNLSAAVSAVLFVAVCMLWVMSLDVERLYRIDHSRGIYATDGRVLEWLEVPIPNPNGYEAKLVRQWSIPLWPLIVLMAIAPAAWGWRKRRTLAWYLGHNAARRRQLRGLCAECGYDLRATPDRCPECGRTPTAKAAT